MNEKNTIGDLFESAFEKYEDQICLRWREDERRHELSYKETDALTKQIGVGFISIGIKNNSKVGIIADVSAQWTLCNIALQRIGAIDVPRASDSPMDELGFILNITDIEYVIIDKIDQIEKIKKSKYKTKIKKFILLEEKTSEKAVSLSSIIEAGKKAISDKNENAREWQKLHDEKKTEDTAALLFTSGTSGVPKGVVLSQKNLVSQVLNLHPKVRPLEKKEALVILPPWHVMGRIMESFFLTSGNTLNYTDIKNLGQDLRELRPHYIPAVPRIWEGVYNKIISNVKTSDKGEIFNFFLNISISLLRSRKIKSGWGDRFQKISALNKITAALKIPFLSLLHGLGNILIYRKIREATGGRMIFSVSGGSRLPLHIEEFFNAIGMPVIEGYGTTETGIVTTSIINETALGTVGRVYPQTEIKILNEKGEDVTSFAGKKGILYIKGPSVMQGYYKDPDATSKRFNNGWFNTQDLVTTTIHKELIILGRTGDTIILKSGENVEPSPIEDVIKQSALVDSVVVVGKNQKFLGALIVPNEEELKKMVSEFGIAGTSIEEWIRDPYVVNQYRKMIKNAINSENGFKSYERVTVFTILQKPFEIGRELNNALKIKRHVIEELYDKEIKAMYNKNGQKVY